MTRAAARRTPPGVAVAADEPLPCRELPPDVFFPEQGSNAGIGVIKTACGRCPIQAACATWGLQHERHGIWGGLTEAERRRERRRRGIRLREPEWAVQPLHPDSIRRIRRQAAAVAACA